MTLPFSTQGTWRVTGLPPGVDTESVVQHIAARIEEEGLDVFYSDPVELEFAGRGAPTGAVRIMSKGRLLLIQDTEFMSTQRGAGAAGAMMLEIRYRLRIHGAVWQLPLVMFAGCNLVDIEQRGGLPGGAGSVPGYAAYLLFTFLIAVGVALANAAFVKWRFRRFLTRAIRRACVAATHREQHASVVAGPGRQGVR